MMASNPNAGNVVIDADPNYNNPNYNPNYNTTTTTTAVNNPAVYNNGGVGISGNIISTAPILTLISLFTFVTALAWFIVELIIVCVSQGTFSNYSYIAPESAQTLQMYMYAIILAVFAYGASWYAHIQRTRAARHLAVFVSIFCLFAWLWQLYYVIPSLRGKNDSSNYYCAGYNSGIDTGSDIGSNSPTNSANRYCYLSQAAASLSVILGFALLLDVLWSMFTAATSIRPEVPIPTRTTVLAPVNGGVNVVDAGYDDYRTELTEPDDLELMKVAVNKPNVYESIRVRMASHSWFTWTINLLTLAGWIVLTCATIKLSRDIGLYAYDNSNSNDLRWGDPIISTLWFPLTVTVGMTIAASAYSSFRMNRAVTASALFICFICGLQWWSFFIYSARRFQQANDQYSLSYFTDKAAQRAMVAGGGIIMCAETIKFFILAIRYLTYMPITRAEHDAIHVPSHVDAPTVIIADKDEFKNGMQQAADQPVNVPGPAAHQLDANGQPTINTERDDTMMWHPSYNLPIMAGTSYFFRFIFYFQVLVLLAFWGNEFVDSCNSGLFNGSGYYAGSGTGTGNNNPTTTTAYSPEYNFYFNEILFIYQTVLILAAWLAMFRAERESSVAASVAAVFVTTICIAGWFLLIWPTAYQSLPNVGQLEGSACGQGGGDWCRLTRAAAIFSFIVLFCLGLVWMNSLARLAERHRLNVMERGIEHIPASIGVLMLAGILIWGFTTIKIGLNNSTFFAQQQSQEPTNNGVDLEESYWASQVFLILVILTVASWTGTYSTKSLYAWQSWFNRLNSWMWSCLLVSVLLPFFVLTCRFIHSQSMDSQHLAIASGIIILFAGAVLYHASILFLCLEAYYTVGPAGAAVPPQGLTANVGPYASDKYGLSVPTKAVPAGAAYTTQPGYSTTVNSVNAPIVTGSNVVEMQQSNVAYGQVPVVEERAY